MVVKIGCGDAAGDSGATDTGSVPLSVAKLMTTPATNRVTAIAAASSHRRGFCIRWEAIREPADGGAGSAEAPAGRDRAEIGLSGAGALLLSQPPMRSRLARCCLSSGPRIPVLPT
ncbi:hypothetical protein Ari01nite_67900 [Paractinoplanes rishiriensis]|uniref:Uncharacterized protein n=1 Tax=Paractinoplanes rishiriensis TaxID=1050105 RepID=A0A919K5I8_9ACTN|nr:hypothetical protein Ari01nite_67900 [Actinoplanes rishiriensis]